MLLFFNMQNKKNIIIFAAIFVAIIGFSAWLIYRDLKFTNQESALINNKKPQPAESTTVVDSEEIRKQMPNLDREIVIKDNTLSEESKDRATSEIKKITETLKADYDRREEWLNLGLWRKTIGDYEGAEQAWLFVTVIRPDDPVAFHNLGDLYAQYLPDFPKAEKNYLAAIEKDTSHNPFYYVKLYEFYRYFSKKSDLAEKILFEALKTNPGDEYLKGILDDLRQSKSQ